VAIPGERVLRVAGSMCGIRVWWKRPSWHERVIYVALVLFILVSAALPIYRHHEIRHMVDRTGAVAAITTEAFAVDFLMTMYRQLSQMA